MRFFSALILTLLLPALAAAQPYWGEYADGGTLNFYTNTIATSGAPSTPVGETVAAYVDGSDTELTTGVTIDDDIDATTGLHRVAIDTTQTGFDAGSTYTVVYTAGTSDSVSLAGRVIGSFRLTTGVNVATIEGSDATDQINAAADTALADYDAPTKAELDAGLAALNDPTAAAIVDEWETQSQTDPTGFHVNLQEWRGTQPTTLMVGGHVSSHVATISVTELNNIRDSILSDSTPFNGADIAAILIDTGTTLPAVLGTPSDLGSGATLADNFTDIAGSGFASANHSLKAIRDRGDAAWTTGGGGASDPLIRSTANAITAVTSQTVFTVTTGPAEDDLWNDHVVIVEDDMDSTRYVVGWIVDSTSGGQITLREDPGGFTIAADDTVSIIAVPPVLRAILNAALTQ